MSPHRTRVGVVKFASCDGCQLTILDLEDQLLAIAKTFDIIEFAEATSNRSAGPYDLLLVEGAVSTSEQYNEIRELRLQSHRLVAIGACATAGGIQALRNWADQPAYHEAIYAHPEYVESLATSTPISDHVKVDGELRGCPISPRELVEFLTAAAVGRRSQVSDEAVCLECKHRGTVCVMVAKGTPCLGPVTHTGCGGICPAYDRGCYACYGPKEHANVDSRTSWLVDGRVDEPAVGRLFEGFTAYEEPFRDVVSRFRHEEPHAPE